MKSSYKQLLGIGIIAIVFFIPQLIWAQSYKFNDNSGLNQTAVKAGFETTTVASPESIAGRVIQTILSLIGILFLGLAIYGGIQWMTAQGNEKSLTQAKGILENAIVGLIIVMAAYALSYFVLKSIASQSIKAL